MPHFYTWGTPSEKIGQNILPPESHFFVINYQQWTTTNAFRPILAPLDHWGVLGGLGGDLGGLQTPKMTLLLGGHFRPWNALFWVITTCLTMFLRFWVKIGPSGPKKAVFGPNRVSKKVDFSQIRPFKFGSYRT